MESKEKPIHNIIFSPHFDDACLSAFNQIDQQTLVVTVFSGKPTTVQSTKWDQLCGFQDSNEAMEERKRENREAAQYLKLQTLDLSFVDWQYNERPQENELYNSFKNVLHAYPNCTLYAPLSYGGLLEHPDHVLVTSTIVKCVDEQKEKLFFYADLPYQIKKKFSWRAVKDPEKKNTACKQYRSQLDNLFSEFPTFTHEDLMKEAVLTYREFRKYNESITLGRDPARIGRKTRARHDLECRENTGC